MELRHLRYFVAVAEELHFGRAAQKLNISQPPLSQQIKLLEKELGVQLFARTKRAVQLTPAGTVFLHEARRILRQTERAKEAAQRAARGETGHLTINFIDAAIYSVIPTIIQKFSQKHPQVKLMISEERIPAQLQALIEKQIDVGFVHPPVKQDELKTELVLREQLILAVPENHCLAGQARVELKSVAGEPLIQFPRFINPELYDQIVCLCRQAGFSPQIVQEASPKQTIVGLVAAHIGVSLLPASLQNLQRPGVLYKEIEGLNLPIDTVAAWRHDNASPTLQAFLKIVKQVAE